MAEVVDDLAQVGIEALRQHAWADAFETLARADAEGGLDARGLEDLAEAAWWAGKPQEHLDAMQRAHGAYLDSGDSRRAAYMAVELSHRYLQHGQGAVSRGWLARAERHLGGEPECVEHGYLLLRRARLAYEAGHLEEAAELARGVMDLGDRYRDRSLWAMGMTTLGQALLPEGAVDEAMALLDEGLAAAVGGELRPRVTGLIYCWALSSYRDLADVKRACEWTEVAGRWCERQAIAGFPGVCRIHRAEIMRLRGAWMDAERDARAASEELLYFSPTVAGDAFAELATVRLRMGNLIGAEEALERAYELGGATEPATALLKSSKGDVDAALAGLAERLAEGSLDRLGRSWLLPTYAEIALAAGRTGEAVEATEELEALATEYATPLFQAAAHQARGALQLAAGSGNEALRSLREALRIWQELDAPYDAARVRVLMARSQRAIGNEDAARSELRAAHHRFEQLGARLDAEAVAGLLAEADAEPSTKTIRTFLFTDIVASTNLLEAIGDEAWRSLMQWHDRMLNGLFTRDGGEVVDHAGDGFFVAFESAASALHCALAIQQSLREHRREHGFSPRVRIGVHTAEALRSGKAFRGRGVHTAARIAATSGADEVVASRDALVAADGRFRTEGARTVTLKGVAEPVEICTVLPTAELC